MTDKAQPDAEIRAVRALLTRPQPVTWVFSGDSITHGALHTFGARDYTEHFSERLRYEMGRGRDCVIKTGISGWTAAGILDDLEWILLRHKPDAVSLMFGMNDCTRGPQGLTAFRTAYTEVIRRTRAALGAAIILHTPNRILSTDTVRCANLPAYVEAVRDIARENGTILIDHNAHWDGVYLFHWLADAIHPGNTGHLAMAHLMFKELQIWDPQSAVCRLFVPGRDGR